MWRGETSSPPRGLDDLQCAYASVAAFLAAKAREEAHQVLCIFDNEEVGSQTKQGAASTFLCDVLTRINRAFGGDGETLCRRVANSFLVSCDNAHAVHPNHPEYADKNHTVRMNAGIVLKYNAAQKYTTDAVSAGYFPPDLRARRRSGTNVRQPRGIWRAVRHWAISQIHRFR